MSGRSEYVWRAVALLGFAMGGAALLLQLVGRAGDNAGSRASARRMGAPALTLAGPGRLAGTMRLR